MKDLLPVITEPVWEHSDLMRLLQSLYRVYGKSRVHEGFCKSSQETTWGELESLIRDTRDPDVKHSEIPLKRPDWVYEDPESERSGGLVLGMTEFDS